MKPVQSADQYKVGCQAMEFGAGFRQGRVVMSLFSPNKMEAPSVEEQWTLDKIPPFPAIALRGLNIMTGRDSSLSDLCDLIRSDPEFSSAVLRMANSPAIGFSGRITSVLQASMLLGFCRLKSVVITIGLKSYLEDVLTPLLQSCWRHCMACAVVAEEAATSADLDKNFAHTAGILHDIGRVAMAASMPHSYARVAEIELSGEDELLKVERKICGIDHCEAGLKLVEAWELPPAFLEIIAGHHHAQDASPGVVAVVRLSCRLADSLGFPESKNRAAHSYAETLAEFPDNLRRNFPGDGRKLAAHIKEEIRMIESA